MQGVDVEAGVGFIEQRQLRFHQQHLHDFVALFLAAGKAFVNAALEEAGIQVDLFAGRAGLTKQGDRIPLFLALGSAHGFQSRFEKFHVGDAGDFHRVLEGQKQAGLGALFRFQVRQAVAFEKGFAAGDCVIVTTRQYVGQSGFAGAIGAHDGVYLARFNGQVQALENRLVRHGGVQITNFQHILMRLSVGPGIRPELIQGVVRWSGGLAHRPFQADFQQLARFHGKLHG